MTDMESKAIEQLAQAAELLGFAAFKAGAEGSNRDEISKLGKDALDIADKIAETALL